MGRYEEALERFERVIVLDPDDGEAHYGAGQALFKLERIKEAEGRFGTAERLDPDHAGAQLGIAGALLMRKVCAGAL